MTGVKSNEVFFLESDKLSTSTGASLPRTWPMPGVKSNEVFFLENDKLPGVTRFLRLASPPQAG